ncbi:hypothetical protein A1O1_08348 [Capronia coronata CBS 617.96]|uniref:Uncharacterized protein n=1 Tax=Capronia coronata CBS 617.96 TaxID=1182541 RepID=W9XT81_9EURO|nr:uncharacterized protein A1O1_08348 [Capronia coronata CBS 617.96]EXJ80206.1 hypothetical protein A1O1_08348 [Capronia coronata CBS 617.96]
MLGARARAAEYNAFKAASARQASREAEEQKLPPKPVPVSLSAFTKSTQPNRNKGTKAYKPLVLEDTSEDGNEDDNETLEEPDVSNGDTPSTPSRPATAAVNRGSPDTGEIETPLGPRNPQPVQATAPAFSAPTAPKAMIAAAAAERKSGFAFPTPQHNQSRSVIRQSQKTVPTSVQSSPSTFSGIGGLPYSDFISPYLPALPPIDYPPQRPYRPSRYFGNTMAPSDLSPTKQENKLNALSQNHAGPSQRFGSTHQQFSESPGMQSRSQIPSNAYAYTNANPDWNAYQQFGGFGSDPTQRPTFQHFNSDGFIPPNEQPRQSRPMPPASLPRRESYPDTEASFLNLGPMLGSPAKIVGQPIQPSSAEASEDEPYDRNSKMQHFVAAQQALAKIGKTVLHNPDLHRTKTIESQGQASVENSVAPAEYQSQIEEKEDRDNHRPGPRSCLKPPQGFESHAAGILDLDEHVTRNPSPLNDEALRTEFGVGTDDWCELKPVSRSERLKMNKAMKLCSTSIHADTPKPLFSRGQTSRRDNILHSLEAEDGRIDPVKRTMVARIADDHVASRLAKNMGSDEVAGNVSEDVEVEKASILAVGEILANLKDAPAADHEAFPDKYKPAPEYAIERGRLLTGQSGSSSFFEEDTGGFYNAPSRIARDPRFRPADKEGNKPKSEDEWKHRFDMYGRRRL